MMVVALLSGVSVAKAGSVQSVWLCGLNDGSDIIGECMWLFG